ncbi:MAG: right-handed parallel beta-helix repeat-containing protein [Bacteroidota bacterium]|jgi:parallel beta-helix repeat protein
MSPRNQTGFLVVLLSLCITSLSAQQRIVPDQFASIQSAIDASAFGDTIMVRAGSYHEFLVLREGVVLRAEGEDDGQWNRALRTTIHSEGLRDGNGDITPVVNCADNAVLDGFTVTGMDTVNHHLPGHSHAVQNRGTSATIMNCIVHSNGSTGIGSHDKDGHQANPMIIHNRVYRNFGIGIGFNQTSKGDASDNEVFENREVGIGIQNGASPLITNNQVYNNGWNGISAREGAWPMLAYNTVFNNGVDPTGENVPEGTGAGIGLDSTGWVARPGEVPGRMLILENTVYGNPSGGIMSRNSSRFDASQNFCYDNANFQISVTDYSDAFVSGNIVYGIDTTIQVGGIVIARGAQAALTNNLARDLATAGIAVTDDAIITASHNTILSCKGSGIHVNGASSAVVFTENSIFFCAGPAVIIEEGTVEMRYNVLRENVGGAIFNPAASVQFINNTVVAPAGAAGRGIAVNGRSGSTCYNNIVVGYGVGFFLEENPIIDYNCTFNNQGYNGPPGTGGAGAIAADPLFTDMSQGNYTLRGNSPCIDSGNPDPQYNDPDGSRNDMGAYPFDGTAEVNDPAVPAKSSLIAYPSITQGRVEVLLNGVREYGAMQRLQLYSVTGVLLRTAEMTGGRSSLDLHALPNGLYFLRVLTADGPLFAKVQVLR